MSAQRGSTGPGESFALARPQAIEGVEVIHVQGARECWRQYVDTWVLSCVTDGLVHNVIDRRRAECPPGSTLVLAPGSMLLGGRVVSPLANAAIVRVSSGAIDRLAERRAGQQAIAPGERLEPRLHRAVCSFVRTVLDGDSQSLETETALEAILRLLGREHNGSKQADYVPRSVRRAREMLHDGLSEQVSLAALAQEVGLSREHLVRAFQARYGEPPHRYLMHLRVAKARTLLARGISATEVAFACGFSDQSHLNRWFKKVVGVTPGQYARAVA